MSAAILKSLEIDVAVAAAEISAASENHVPPVFELSAGERIVRAASRASGFAALAAGYALAAALFIR